MTQTPVKMKPVNCNHVNCKNKSPLYGKLGTKEWYCEKHFKFK